MTAEEAVLEQEPLMGEVVVPVAAEAILPCHHGCTCRLHAQLVYGQRVPDHPPEVLDQGEMGLLTEAAEQATRRLNGYHNHLQEQRTIVVEAWFAALHALDAWSEVLAKDWVAQARGAMEAVEERFADLPAEMRLPTPRWLVWLTFGLALAVGLFEAVFFQKAFLDILNVPLHDVSLDKVVGVLAAASLAVGLVVTGRILAEPLWHLARRWRTQASPDQPPPSRRTILFRITLLIAGPGAILFVLGYWANLRGELARLTAQDPGSIYLPESYEVMMLLMIMALTVILLEVLIYNPYQAGIKIAERELRRREKEAREVGDRARSAVSAYEIAWRDLRSCRDEVIAIVRAELARPWHEVILPARLRHGRATPVPVPPDTDVDSATGAEMTDTEDPPRVFYRIFQGVEQPQPGLGPLAETIRTVRELRPEELAKRHPHLPDPLIRQRDEPSGIEGDGTTPDAGSNP
ncbi:hypothetical protein ACIBO2_44725 [Nonomuraea sp. NPDC050022]|uniref:hypothetical protein n=1 Tax=unclassified Nonomuraea TaxID=2593643 RepID=UPI0033C5C61A